MVDLRWSWILSLGLISGFVLWGLTSPSLFVIQEMPLFLWLWSPVLAVSSLVYCSHVNPSLKRRSLLSGSLIWALAGYCFLLASFLPEPAHTQYLEILIFHLPLIAWIGLGSCLIPRPVSTADRFSLLIKSLEVVMTAGFFMLALGIFVGVTEMLFSTLHLDIPDVIIRLLITLGLGLTGLIAFTLCFNPLKPPSTQYFQSHLLALLALVARLFMPLVLIVLAIYICVIPFNFLIPFQERDVLVAYNLLLFAVLGLLIAATSHDFTNVPARFHAPLRWLITLIAGLAAIITVYALTATVYRTFQNSVTINRLAIIGWNVVNLSVLITLVWKQVKAPPKLWVTALHQTFARSMICWAVWAICLILLLPVIFL